MQRLRPTFIAAMLATAIACTTDKGGVVDPTPNPPGPKVVATVEITGAPQVLSVGFLATLTATARAADGSAIAGKIATWESSNASATVNAASGIVTGVAPGAVVISATIDGKSAAVNINVQQATVATVTVDPNNFVLMLDEQRTLNAVLRDEMNHVLAGRAVTWVSNAPEIASVEANTGKVVAKEGGNAVITATSEGKSTNVNVTVQVPVATVTIVDALDSLEAYDVRDLKAVLKDAKGRVLNGRPITWTTSSGAIATVDNTTARLTGVDRGTVTITATSEGKSSTATRVVVILYRYISAGTMHACDLASGGIAWCWGLNGVEGRIGSAQVGDGQFSATPNKVPGGLRFSQLSTFGRTTCAVALDQDAYCWGNNAWGILGAGSNAAMSFTPVKVAGNQKFKKVSAGADHACGIDITGKAWCWGNNDWRQQGAGTTAASNAPVAVATNALFMDIGAGSGFSCGLATTGEAICWGQNNTGQVGDGLALTNANVFQALPKVIADGHLFIRISVGPAHSCAVTIQGLTYCWGSNGGKFGNGLTTSTSVPMVAATALGFINVSAGFGHTCGVTATNEARCWGANGYGQLGAGTTNGSLLPIRAGGNLKFAEVAAAGIGTGSAGHTCGISQDRLTALCWGRNDVGQLGNSVTGNPDAFNPTATIVTGQKPL